MSRIPQTAPDRIERGLRLAHAVTQTGLSSWTVQSESDQSISYTVTNEGCNCPDARKGFICKHQYAAHLLATLTIHQLRRTPSVQVADQLLESFHLASEDTPEGIKMTVRLEHERALMRLDSAHDLAVLARVYNPRQCTHPACTSSRCNQGEYYGAIAV